MNLNEALRNRTHRRLLLNSVDEIKVKLGKKKKLKENYNLVYQNCEPKKYAACNKKKENKPHSPLIIHLEGKINLIRYLSIKYFHYCNNSSSRL